MIILTDMKFLEPLGQRSNLMVELPHQLRRPRYQQQTLWFQ